MPLQSAGAESRQPLRVFIADDSETIRERLAELLSELEGVVLLGQAANAAEAEAGIRTTRPDVAIVDIQMPGGSGIDVVRKLRAESAERPPSFIMYTNYGLPQYRKAAEAAGADFFFDKSTQSGSLTQALRDLAARPRAPRQPD